MALRTALAPPVSSRVFLFSLLQSLTSWRMFLSVSRRIFAAWNYRSAQTSAAVVCVLPYDRRHLARAGFHTLLVGIVSRLSRSQVRTAISCGRNIRSAAFQTSNCASAGVVFDRALWVFVVRGFCDRRSNRLSCFNRTGNLEGIPRASACSVADGFGERFPEYTGRLVFAVADVVCPQISILAGAAL